MEYSVGQAAELAGVTVRTLHHYDEIGLLSPSGRTAAGYRVYGERDLERLRQVLFYRSLGLALHEIAGILADPGGNTLSHLRRQHALLTERIAGQQRMLTALEKEMEAYQMGINLTPQERFELFGDFMPEDYQDEARERWADTGAWRESQRRTSAYGKSDWAAIRAESGAIEAGFAAAMRSGVAPDSQAARELAERHRAHITRWFYDCAPGMHRGLGEIYVADQRFRGYFEKIAPGLAAYVRDAIAANAGDATR